jgi:kinesin family protein 4/21/27
VVVVVVLVVGGDRHAAVSYGQTSSGKSYTMGTTGMDEDYDPAVSHTSTSDGDRIGIIPRAVSDVFARVDELSKTSGGREARWECRCSFLELYNEVRFGRLLLGCAVWSPGTEI